MWIYKQQSGDLYHNSSYEGAGYSGHSEGVNDPDMQSVTCIGPIPEGQWIIGPAQTRPPLGPIVFALSPCTGTDTFGRSSFFIHGDNSLMNDTGSEGCIVMGRAIRQAIADSGDTSLQVIKD